MAEPEFTDTARAALLWVLWHHQGGSSPVGQPIRFALGMGQHDRLSAKQVRQAKAWDALMSERQRATSGVPALPAVCSRCDGRGTIYHGEPCPDCAAGVMGDAK